MLRSALGAATLVVPSLSVKATFGRTMYIFICVLLNPERRTVCKAYALYNDRCTFFLVIYVVSGCARVPQVDLWLRRNLLDLREWLSR